MLPPLTSNWNASGVYNAKFRPIMATNEIWVSWDSQYTNYGSCNFPANAFGSWHLSVQCDGLCCRYCFQLHSKHNIYIYATNQYQ